MRKGDFQTVDEYIALFEGVNRKKLEQLRETVRSVAPNASESISYHMPAYKLNGKVLVYFACQKSHIGFYPTPSAIEAFKDVLTPYKTSKGVVQFKLSEDLPLNLVKEMVQFKVSEVIENR